MSLEQAQENTDNAKNWVMWMVWLFGKKRPDDSTGNTIVISRLFGKDYVIRRLN